MGDQAEQKVTPTDQQEGGQPQNLPAKPRDRSIDGTWHTLHRSVTDFAGGHGSWNTITDSTNNFLGALRYNSIRALPAFVVNNSSNLLGAAHVYTEGIMFKASIKSSVKDGKLVPGKLVENASNPVDYLIKAIYRIYNDAIHGAFKTRGGRVNIMDGNPAVNIFKFLTDTKAATEREIAVQQVAPEMVRLGNPWQMRSTLSGLIGWTISTILPEKKESDTEIERMEIMRKTNPVGYIGTRLGQGLWLPGWISHKRQAIGIGQLTSGVFSTLGAWRNRTEPTAIEIKGGKLPRYVFSLPYLCTGICNLLAGAALTFAPDEQSGYSQYGGWVMAMTAFLPLSIREKFQRNEGGAAWYTAGKLSFQAEAWGQGLFGGAEKKPDGTIVDHDAIRKEADAKALEIRRERKLAKYHGRDVPQTKIEEVSQRETLAAPAEQKEAYV